MLLQLLSLYATFNFFYLLLFVQFVPNLRDKRLKKQDRLPRAWAS